MTSNLDQAHFFSWQSRISLLLPADFVMQQVTNDQNAVIHLARFGTAEISLLTRCQPLFPGEQQAALRRAEQTAQQAGYQLLQRQSRTLAGAPALVQQLEHHTAAGSQQRFECFAEAHDRLFSITCDWPSAGDHELGLFLQWLDSARLIPLSEERPASLDVQTGHLAHRELRLSAWLPDGWIPFEEDSGTLRFYGPALPEQAGFQPSFSITLAEPNDYSEGWLTHIIDERRQHLLEQRAYQLLEQRPLQLSGQQAAEQLGYRWQADETHCFCMQQTFVQADYRSFYLISATTLESMAAEQLPLFEQMLENLRFLPSH